jgi:hypothetical protein
MGRATGPSGADGLSLEDPDEAVTLHLEEPQALAEERRRLGSVLGRKVHVTDEDPSRRPVRRVIEVLDDGRFGGVHSTDPQDFEEQ